MREIVSLHIGQAGCGVGYDMWAQFSRETPLRSSDICDSNVSEVGKFVPGESTFFNLSSSGLMTPRSIFVDTDPVQETSFRLLGPVGNLRDPQSQLCCSKRDGRSVYHAGNRECQDSGLVESAFDKLMDQVETCNNIGGFLIQRSIGGGSGSVVGDMLLSRIREEFPKTVILETLIYPSRDSSTSALEPLNTVLSLAASRSSPSLSLVLDNQAAYRISQTKLGVAEPSYTHMNSFISQVVSSCTASLRFPSTLNSSLGEIVTNLVPDPTLRYSVVSVAPLNANPTSNLSAKDLVSSLFHPQSYLCEVPNMRDHSHLAACIQCHGSVPLANLQKTIQAYRNSSVRNPVKFAPWISTSFKVGLVNSVHVPAATMLSNSTAVSVPFADQLAKFDSLFSTRKFLWHFMENGAELDEFYTARDSVAAVVAAYESVKSTCEDESKKDQLKRIEKISM